MADLGERLMNDGIDVVLDEWSLKDGQDLNSFMEQMVTDKSIKRVIIVSDAQYAEKANVRKGGVGTESQIISEEVYKKVRQEKFVPLLRERDAEGKPCLPVFLKSRKYIDFSDADKEGESYDQLIRNIHERPVRRKPALGKPPSHLFEDDAVVIPGAQKGKRFRDLVTSGKGNPSAAFGDFAEEFLLNLEDLRLVYSHDQKHTWCQTIFDNIEKAKAYRNVYVDVVRIGVMHVREEWFMPSLFSFLEHLLPFQFRPEGRGSFFKCSEDNYKFVVYELFLYTLAAFIKARRYEDGRSLLDHNYVAPETFNGQRLESFSFTLFNTHAESLEGECANRGDTRRLSVMAELLHDRADRKDIRFFDLLQAEAICCIAACRRSRYCGWYPRSFIYAGRAGKLELFVRAIDEQGFQPLKTLLQCPTPKEMIRSICSDQMNKSLSSRDFWDLPGVEELFNLKALRSQWLPEVRDSV